MRNRILPIVLITLSIAACGTPRGSWTNSGSAQEPSTATPSPSLQARVETSARPALVRDTDASRHVWKEERRFYEQNGYRLVWTDGTRPRPQLEGLLRALRAADQDGLDPADYYADELTALRQPRVDADRALELDLLATYAYLAYGWELTHGRFNPKDIDPNWHAAERPVDLPAALQHGIDENKVAESLQQLAPASPQYVGLKQLLARHREIEAKGGWPQVPDTPVLKHGARHSGVALLRQRLAASGDLDDAAPSGEPDLYDDRIAEAVRRFQARHGIEADGVYTKAVAAAINVPVGERARQITMNMERWRWLRDDLGSRYLLVNIPAFRLDAIENGRSVLSMKVVTGKPGSATPVLTDEITSVVFSPYWNIPPTIARNETLPHVLKDPGYLERNNIEVVGTGGETIGAATDWNGVETGNLRFRQRPGKGNSLGSVKFVFPNHFNVYLHDTPAQSLFDRIERDFSHGCVRVERPAELARYVLRDQPDWTEDRITQAMDAGVERGVPLKQPLPIYLVYFTAWEENGTTQFRNDVYGYDKKTQAK